jgi:hypothetical protein
MTRSDALGPKVPHPSGLGHHPPAAGPAERPGPLARVTEGPAGLASRALRLYARPAAGAMPEAWLTPDPCTAPRARVVARGRIPGGGLDAPGSSQFPSW